MRQQTTKPGRRVFLAAASMLAGAALPGAAMAQAGATWTTQGGDQQGTRYSALTEINTSNVGKLVEDFRVPTGAIEGHEGGPLVVNNTLYAVTPWPNNLIALDLTRNGKLLWTYQPNTDPFSRGKACCDSVNRGAAYADGMIIYNTLDGRVIAVDAGSGTLRWSTRIANETISETLTGAPIIARNRVIVGNSGAEDGVRGAVYGLDLQTGKLVWKAYNAGPDSAVKIGPNFHAFYAKDQGVNLGETTWPGLMWQHGGATAWGYKTYDPKTNLFYYGTANAGPWDTTMRPGDNKWAATIFARDPNTGEAAWAYQVTPHDSWDFDSISESIVADLPINGVTRQIIFHVDKNGFAYTIDRRTGQVLVAGAVGDLTWSTGIDLQTGKPNVVPSQVPGEGKIIAHVCPGPGGVKDEEPAAYSFTTNLFYIPAHNLCAGYQDIRAMYVAGTPYFGYVGPQTASPGSPGILVAWNAATGHAAWTIKEPYPLWGGVLATAGNVVFYGTLSNGSDTPSTPTVKAVDAKTGALLWSTKLECNTVGNPMSFLGADGKQRIAIFTGTGPIGFAGTGKCPSVAQFNPTEIEPGRVVKLFGQTYYAPPAARQAPGISSGFIHVFKLP